MAARFDPTTNCHNVVSSIAPSSHRRSHDGGHERSTSIVSSFSNDNTIAEVPNSGPQISLPTEASELTDVSKTPLFKTTADEFDFGPQDQQSRLNGGLANSKSKEWIPPLLRSTASIPLLTAIIVFLVILEGFDILDRRRKGFSPANDHPVSLARHLPTVIVILFGFVWKMLVRDLKKVTPWSVMSSTKGDRWVSADHSIMVNYIDDLEVVSVFTSLRRRHWAVFLGLIGGFICGLMIVWSNALFFVDLEYTSTSNISILRSSKFVFDPLPKIGQGMRLGNDYLSDRPFTALVAAKRLGGSYPFGLLTKRPSNHSISVGEPTSTPPSQQTCQPLVLGLIATSFITAQMQL